MKTLNIRAGRGLKKSRARDSQGKAVKGKKEGTTVEIENAGAEFFDREVVIDGNLVTSRYPEDLPAFCKACLEKLNV
ncbi:MAG: DJ-1/PfpI family protein [Waddliaceae bacterium]